MSGDTPIPLVAKPGVTRDKSTASSPTAIDALWARWDGIDPCKIWGYRSVNRQLTDISRGLGSFSRAGNTYVHSAGKSKIEQVVLDASGSSAGIADRTPALFSASDNYDWTFDHITDPATRATQVLAHGGLNLAAIDATDELPVWWGQTNLTTALAPMALPILNTGLTVASPTASITSGSPDVTVASTTGLTYGMQVFGTGIPSGAYIFEVASGTVFKLGQAGATVNATATNASAALTIKVGGVSGGVISLFPYVMAYGSDGRIVWSTPDNPNDFWGTGSGEAFITDQKIVRMVRARAGPGLEPGALVFSLNALQRLTFRGGDTVWGSDTIDDEISVLSPRSVVMVDGVAYWPGVDKFYSFAGTVREIPNPQNLRFFYGNLNMTHRMKVWGVYVSKWGEIWWFFPKGTATEPNHVVILNLRTGAWYDTPAPNGGRTAGVPARVFAYPLMTGLESVGSPPKYRLWQHEYGVNEVTETGTRAIRSYFVMPQVSLLTNAQPMNAAIRITAIEPDLEQVGDMTVKLLKRATPRGDLVTAEEKIIPADPTPQQEFIRFKQEARRAHLHFESNAVNGDYKMNALLGHASAGSRRQTQ